LRLRLQNHVRPVSSVRCSASRFIHANMSTCFVLSSCTIAGTSPSSLNETASSSSFVNGTGVLRGGMRPKS
jgi:hypothetical protein